MDGVLGEPRGRCPRRPPRTIADARIDEWQRMIDTNVTGVLRVIGAFAGDLNEAARRSAARTW
jgi:NADP-dependent 3-hydroxy acid dehydrogenase YdfG